MSKCFTLCPRNPEKLMPMSPLYYCRDPITSRDHGYLYLLGWWHLDWHHLILRYPLTDTTLPWGIHWLKPPYLEVSIVWHHLTLKYPLTDTTLPWGIHCLTPPYLEVSIDWHHLTLRYPLSDTTLSWRIHWLTPGHQLTLRYPFEFHFNYAQEIL